MKLNQTSSRLEEALLLFRKESLKISRKGHISTTPCAPLSVSFRRSCYDSRAAFDSSLKRLSSLSEARVVLIPIDRDLFYPFKGRIRGNRKEMSMILSSQCLHDPSRPSHLPLTSGIEQLDRHLHPIKSLNSPSKTPPMPQLSFKL